MGFYHPLRDSGDLPATGYSFDECPSPAAPQLSGEIRADVAIIGAGIMGLSAALHAAQAGASVAVLEANQIGWGASGRNFGQVVPYLRHEPEHAIATLGPRVGERLIRAAADGAKLVFDLIDRHQIACASARGGLLFAAHTPNALGVLERRRAFWESRGEAPDLLDSHRTAEAIGGGSYWGSIRERRGGTLNALCYCRGLARAAIEAGASVHCHSRVTALRRDGTGWRATTGAGSVLAQTVMLCANAYTDELWPGLERSVIPVRAYQLVSRPLPEAVRATVLPGANSLTDTRRLMSGIRRYASGRLHVSGPVGPFGPERAPASRGVEGRILKLFPHLGRVEWERWWSGWVAMTPDEYPRFHELAPGVLAGIGYSGRGLSLATVMGRELARRAAGATVDDLVFPVTALKPIPLPAVTRLAVKGLSRIYWLRDKMDAMQYGRGPTDMRGRRAPDPVS